MTNILDFHTHRLDATAAIISVNPRQFDPKPGKWYSVGFHPWYDVDRLTDDDFILLEQCARHPQVLTIGETGMDSLRGADIDIQARVFTRHLQVAASVDKPVVVHSVKTAQRILNERHKANLDRVTLAIHGMRANERVARTLLDAGCYLSFGMRYNPTTLLSTPLDRLLIETDDALDTINEVATSVAAALSLNTEDLFHVTTANVHRLVLSGSDQ